MAKDKFERQLNKLSRRPKGIKGAGKAVNAGSRIGVQIIQLSSVKPLRFGYRKGKK